MAKIYENRPAADVLMVSMRAMGYTFEAAIADVIDNSISADASLIELGFPASPAECHVTISDNGTGMTHEMFQHDLFPEDFIVALPTPSNYIGAKEIFDSAGRYHSQVMYIQDAGVTARDNHPFYYLHKDALYPTPGRRRADVHTPEQRRYNMQQIKAKHTEPEERIARYLFRNGFRGYRRNVKDLPGTPDFVLSRYNTVIFVNGCFWHGHEGCRYFKYPQTNEEFWREKINGNRARDQRKIEELQALGWRVIVIWECELKDNAEATLTKLANDIRNQQ